MKSRPMFRFFHLIEKSPITALKIEIIRYIIEYKSRYNNFLMIFSWASYMPKFHLTDAGLDPNANGGPICPLCGGESYGDAYFKQES